MKTKLFTLFFVLLASIGTMFASVKIGDLYYNFNQTLLTAEVASLPSGLNNSTYKSYEQIKTRNIPSTITYNGTTYDVTSIGNSAFSGCYGMTSITIPNSVTSIGNYAFSNCSGLTSIEIPNSVTSIGESAFSSCTGFPVIDNIRYADTYLIEAADKTLSSYTINEDTKWIANKAFSGCNNLTSIIIPNNVKNIGAYAFSQCTNLSTITIGENVTNIENFAFNGCVGLSSIVIADGVQNIERCAFYGCSGLTHVTIGKGVTNIEDKYYDSYYKEYRYVFSGCNNISSVVWNAKNCNVYYFGTQVNTFEFGNEVEVIPASICKGMTQLTSMTIPNSVTSIGDNAFSGCSGLTSITLGNSVTSIGNGAFSGCTSLNSPIYNAHIYVFMPASYSGAYSIPDGIKSIYGNAFAGCINLTSIIIPNSVTDIGDGAFYGCTGLTSIEIPNSVTSIGNSAFSVCTGVTSLTLGDSVTSIGDKAFNCCTGLTSVTIPNSVTSIERWAFTGCDNLKTITLNSEAAINVQGSSSYNHGAIVIYGACQIFGSQVENIIIGDDVTNIGAMALSSFSNLQSITIGKSVTGIAGNAFSGCSNITSVAWNAKNSNGYNFGSQVNSFIFGSEVEVIPASICSGMTQLTSMTIPNSVTSIGDNAFSGCTGLTEIVIPINITNIGNSVFSGCNSITSVYWNAKNSNGYNFGSQVNSFIFGNEVEIIPASICSGMTQLTSMTIPNSVTSIGDNAFSGCAGLRAVTIPSNVAHIGDNAFAGCPRLSSMIVENGNTEYDSRDNCNAIILSASNTLIFGCKNTKFPSSVTSIGNYAFNGCSSLKSVIIPNHVTNVGEYAFNNCSGMTSAKVSSNMKTISSHMFNNCARLSSVIMNGNVTNIEEGAFAGCTSLTSITIPDNVTNVGMYAFDGCSGLTSAITSNNMTVIKSSTFRNCSRLASVTIGRNVTDVESGAFYGCPVTSVTLLSNAIVSRNYTPESNISNIFGSQIKEYILGTGINRLGNNAFYGCSGVQSITILRTTPPSGYSSALDNICYGYNQKHVPIFVPCGCLEAYNNSWFGRYIIRYAPQKYKITGLVNSESMGRVLVADDVCGGITAESYEGYHFVQWSDGETENPRYVELTKDTTFKAIFAINEYVITWLNEDSSLIDQKTVVHGVVPTHSEPIKPATAEYTYTFAGWTPAVVAATSDATYRAQFKATKNSYTITWQNEDGSLIDQTTVEYGVIPTHADPVKQNTAEYTYTFAGWTPAVVAVTGDATYKATFNATKNKYLITFRNDDGTVLKSEEVEYGVMPIVPTDPTKESTAQYDYTFAGWTPAVAIVTQAATYTATYTSALREYLVTFLNEDNTVISSKNYKYGETPVAPADPVKQNTAEYTYTFNGWDHAIAQVQGPQTYKATFTATKNSYTITWQDENGSLIDQTIVEYGQIPAHADPIKQNTAEYTYTFSGWTPAVVAVTGDATYKATFSSVVNVYTISVSAVNGQVIGGGEYQYGTTTDLTAIPDEGYVFDQWSDGVTDNPRTITVTGDVEYTALFKSAEGFENIYTSEPVQKVMIDQKVYILRGEKVYTVTGQEVR